MARMKVPHVPGKPVPVLTDDEVKSLLSVCAGGEFAQRRNTAIVQMLRDTGMRRAELSNLTLADLDLDLEDRVAFVIGKGRRHGPARSRTRPPRHWTDTFACATRTRARTATRSGSATSAR